MPHPCSGAMLVLLLCLSVATALIVSAPDSCGGTHVVTHATAFFGPKPAASSVRDVLLFAPRAQIDGAFVRSSIPARRSTLPNFPTRRLITGVLFGDGRRRSRTVARPQPPPPPPQPALETPATLSNPSAHSAPVALDNEDASRTLDHSKPFDENQFLGPLEEPEAGQDPMMHDVDLEERLPGADPSVLPVRVKDSNAQPDVPFNLFNACRHLSVPSDIQTVKGRVAVVARGVCDFAQKVGLMQAAGAVGVIVVNFKDGGEQLVNMKLNDTKKNPEINIPAVMIQYEDWATIAPCRNDTKVVFTGEGEATFDMDYRRDALNWAMMRGMALWILCQCGVNVVRYKRRVSEFRARLDAIAALPVDTYERPVERDEAQRASGEAGSMEDISAASNNESIPGPPPGSPILDHDPERMPLVPSDGESAAPSSSTAPPRSTASTTGEDAESASEEPMCAVCLEEFETGQQVRQLACSHLYHRTCIDPWLQSSSNCCPLCKREVPNLPPPPPQVHYGSMVV